MFESHGKELYIRNNSPRNNNPTSRGKVKSLSDEVKIILYKTKYSNTFIIILNNSFLKKLN